MGHQSTLKPRQAERFAAASPRAMRDIGDEFMQTSFHFLDASGETGRLSELTLRPAPSRPILADPPWQFQNRTGKIAPEHKRLARYCTLTLAGIMQLPVGAAWRGLPMKPRTCNAALLRH